MQDYAKQRRLWLNHGDLLPIMEADTREAIETNKGSVNNQERLNTRANLAVANHSGTQCDFFE